MNSRFQIRLCRVLMCLLIGTLISVAVSSPAATQEKQLVIRVPEGIDTANLTVLVGIYGHGLALESVQKNGSREYMRQLPDWTTNVKLLIQHPEYKIIAATLDPQTVTSQPYIPQFVKATMAPLTLRVIDTNGKPFANQRIDISSDLAGMSYFGYADGMVFDGKITNGITDSNGEFSTSVPSILDDAYCQLYGIRSFGIRLAGNNRLGKYGYDILPQSSIPAQRSYANPLIMTIRYRGQLSGKVERSFLAKHGIADNQPSVFAQRHGDRDGIGRYLKPDGSFSIPVSEGTYDLTIKWDEDNKIHIATALKDVVVGENKEKVVLIR